MAPPETPWKGFRADAAAGRIVFKHEEAQRLAGGARRVRDVIRSILADPQYKNLWDGTTPWYADGPNASGQSLTHRFTKMAKDVDAALRGHEKALTDMLYIFKTAAPKIHDSAEEWSKAAFKDPTRAPRFSPLKQTGSGWADHRVNLTEQMKAFTDRNDSPISHEYTESLSYEQLIKIAKSMNWTTPGIHYEVWSGVWKLLHDNVGDIHNTFGLIDDSAWSGTAPEKIRVAAKGYAGNLESLQNSVEVLAHSLWYVGSWLKNTYDAMKRSYSDDIRLVHADYGADARPAQQPPAGVALPPGKYFVDRYTDFPENPPAPFKEYLTKLYRINLDGIYHKGLDETVQHMPAIPAAASPVGSIPTGPGGLTGPGGGGGGLPTGGLPTGSGLAGLGSATQGGLPVGALTSGLGGLAGPGSGTGGLGAAADQLGALGDAASGALQQATGAAPPGGLPTGGLPTDGLPAGGLPTGGLPGGSGAATKGALDKASAAGGGGKAGGLGGAKPLGTNLAAQAAQAAKLFPRAGLAEGLAGRGGAPMAGSPGSPGSAAPARGGQGKGEGEYKRADYLDSTAHMEEALGETPIAFRPVLEP